MGFLGEHHLKPIYGIIALIGFLLILTPFARVYDVNLVFAFAVFAASSYAAGVWIVIALRDKGGTVIFMKDSVRKSRLANVIAKSGETTTGRLPGLAAIPYGGFLAPVISVADVNLGVVPASSIEDLSSDTTLVYSPTTPLKSARSLKSVMAFFSKSASVHTFLSFSDSRKSRSEARFGLLNGLISTITTDALMEQERLINRSGGIVDMLERAEQGEDANIEELQRMIKVAKKTAPLDKAKTFFFGGKQTESQSDRPSQREPQ